MEKLLERAGSYLKQKGSASTDELVDELLGSTSGNRRLAARVVKQALHGQPGILESPGGQWRLAPDDSEPPPGRHDAQLPRNLLWVDKGSGGNPVSGVLVYAVEEEARQSLAVFGTWRAGRLLLEVCEDDAVNCVKTKTATEFGAILQTRLGERDFWYLARETDWRRWIPFLGKRRSGGVALWPAARLVCKLPRAVSKDALARALEIPAPDDDGRALSVRSAWLRAVVDRIVEALVAQGIRDLEALRIRLAQEPDGFDYSRYAFGPADLAAIPTGAGTYCFWDRSGTLLYIGKARNLRRRILSYFRTKSSCRPVERILLRTMHSLEYHPLGSELAALVEESALIRGLRPDLNTQFEVRSPVVGEFAERAAVVVFRALDRENALDLWCLCPQKKARMLRLRPTAASRKKLHEQLKRLYFSERAGRSATPDATSKILAAWLHRNRDSANWIAPDRVAGVEELMAQVEAYARDSHLLEEDRIIYRKAES